MPTISGTLSRSSRELNSHSSPAPWYSEAAVTPERTLRTSKKEPSISGLSSAGGTSSDSDCEGEIECGCDAKDSGGGGENSSLRCGGRNTEGEEEVEEEEEGERGRSDCESISEGASEKRARSNLGMSLGFSHTTL